MPIKTTTMGPGTLTIGADALLTNFSSQVRSIKLVPNVSQDDPIPVLSGEELQGDREETFTLEGTLLQDFGQTDSTTEWLWEHRGETHDFVYVPSTAAGKEITGQIIVEAIEIGGEAKTKPESDFEFRVVGEPIIAPII